MLSFSVLCTLAPRRTSTTEPATTKAPPATMPHPILNDPSRNVGRRFSPTVRQAQNLVGLVHTAPPKPLLHEIQRLLAALRDLTPLAKYQFLMRVLHDDEQLFFAATQANLPAVLPMIYTPTVGDACLRYSDLHIPMRGMWLGFDQRGRLDQVLANWQKEVDVIVVSDCERILGLGDLGANGMGIPVGKLLLYSACGGIDPARCLPVVLDAGCDNDAMRGNDNYIGLNMPRVRGPEYDDFVQEFMDAAVKRFGKTALIQFEDFGNGNALRLLDRYRESYCCFNDDIQGTAAVGLAGLLSAVRIKGVKSRLAEHKFLFLGAGSAGIGIARLIVLALVREGVSEEDARKQCFFVDSKGLVYDGRAEFVSDAKAQFAHEVDEDVKKVAKDGLEALVEAIRPTALIGVSTIRGAFSEDVIKKMAEINEKPIIFALSNPTSKAECTAEQAYTLSEGRAVFASGSPFKPVKYEGRTYVPGQGNNSYIFPGLGLGIILSGARHVPESMLLTAADVVAKLVDEEQLESGCVYPDLNSLMDISAHIAVSVCEEAKRLGLNSKNVDGLGFAKVRGTMYEPGRGLI